MATKRKSTASRGARYSTPPSTRSLSHSARNASSASGDTSKKSMSLMLGSAGAARHGHRRVVDDRELRDRHVRRLGEHLEAPPLAQQVEAGQHAAVVAARDGQGALAAPVPGPRAPGAPADVGPDAPAEADVELARDLAALVVALALVEPRQLVGADAQ